MRDGDGLGYGDRTVSVTVAPRSLLPLRTEEQLDKPTPI